MLEGCGGNANIYLHTILGVKFMAFTSAIYEGTIRHRRFTPVVNTFKYRLFLMYLDLEELQDLFSPYQFWSLERPNAAMFQRSDYLGDSDQPLDTAVRNLVERQTGNRPSGPIRMLAHMRYFGFCFNPVAFYYCFDEGGIEVETIVAEINNTPWMERHQYVLDESMNQHPNRDWRRYRLEKDFHISPYMDMQISYDWRFRRPGETINVHLNNFSGGRKLFDATLQLSRREINQRNLSRMLLKYPFMTAKVTSLIYWQALRLKVKGVPFYDHPDHKATVPKGGQ
jgi:uncharacterized protein